MKLDTSKTELYYLLLDLDDQQKAEALETLRSEQPQLYQQIVPLVAAEQSDQLEQIFQFTFEQGASQQVDYTNQQIDKYQILHELGRGGLGVVYAACRADKAFEQQLAIKFLQSDLSGIFDSQALFGEAQLLAKLNHPNIAKVFDGGIHQGAVYIVMEQINGVALNHYLEQHALSHTERLAFLVQICGAVEHAHQQGVLHADLKPENILIDSAQQVKLIDFNLTQKSNATTPRSHCNLTAFSKEYASPEQQSGQQLTIRSDVYSLGKLLNWLCPNDANDSDIKALIKRATAVTPSKRYPNAAELEHDIVAILTKRPISIKRHQPLYRFTRLFQRNPLICSLCLLIIVSGYYFSYTLAQKNHQLEQEKQIAQDMIYEVSSMMFHAKSQAAQEMPVHAVLDLTRRRILANPDIPKHIKQKLLLVMMTPIEEKAAPNNENPTL
ncbi:serine/threonine protein kinase [Vibrio sinaloensis DSM 21326]|uniref:Serine/threonine protein kinase n=1 Tax=Vibrio sinaloensis DSM 21326 TaxID=945550 RepID=E8MCC1_PHOS4|nr:serine/threonine-protein kinase [Vibrio sinaloensis]EGA68289.1 serine/threonine protein kinase [Vibrio sinaloensis DSM 21326]